MLNLYKDWGKLNQKGEKGLLAIFKEMKHLYVCELHEITATIFGLVKQTFLLKWKHI